MAQRVLGEDTLARLDPSPGGREDLTAAVATLAASPSWRALQEVADALPPAAGVEVVLVLARETAVPGKLSPVAASGLAPRDLGLLAFEPLSLSQARTLIASGTHSLFARELGLRWAQGSWLTSGSTLGALLVGSRTRRVPGPADLVVLDTVAAEVSRVLGGLDREPRRLRSRATALAREGGIDRRRRQPLGGLRSREVEILELYADGLTTAEIAELLVISPHTVRTHVRNALRRLGVRSRGEAVARLQRWQVLRLVQVEAASP